MPAAFSASSTMGNVGHATPLEIKQDWLGAVRGLFPDDIAEEYATTLSKQYVTLVQAASLTDAQLSEMRVRIGHRGDLIIAAANAVCQEQDLRRDSPAGGGGEDKLPMVPEMDVVDISANENQKNGSVPPLNKYKWISESGDDIVDLCNSMEPAQKEAPTAAAFSRSTRRRKSSYVSTSGTGGVKPSPSLLCKEYSNRRSLLWCHAHGEADTLQTFLEIMSDKRRSLGFPESFDRAMADNHSMPFTLIQGSSVLLLLRIPNLAANLDGYTISTITNRFVIMFSKKRVLTYHKCEHDFLRRLTLEWSDMNDLSVVELVDRILRRVNDSYVHGVDALQNELIVCEDLKNRIEIVERLTLAQKKAQVYSRCLKAGMHELEDLNIVQGFQDVVTALMDHMRSLTSSVDEISENVTSTINMQMALDGFRSSVNMKVFTYLSILCQPITVATGWYGMNWTNFPELLFEHGYFTFAGVIVGFSVCLLAFFVLRDILTQ